MQPVRLHFVFIWINAYILPRKAWYNRINMIRTNTPSKSRAAEPVYRHVLRQAWHFAWREKRYWFLAFFASFLLTAGTYDIIGNSYLHILQQNEIMSGVAGPMLDIDWNGMGGITNILSAFEGVILICVIILALLAFSCVAQGALIYCIGAAHKGEKAPVKKALGIGARAFWPIATLNVLVLLVYAVAKFLIAAFLNIALADGSVLMGLIYVAIFVVLMAVVFAITIIQIFALNAMILQGASVSDAILRGYTLFVRHWVVSVETALLLALVSILFNFFITYVLFIGAVPVVLAIITASVIQSPIMFWSILALAGIGLGIVILASIAFLAQLQYACWTFLYRKIGEGGVLAKLHRLARSIFSSYSVPQN